MDPAVSRLKEYLRIRTDHPNIDYLSVIEFLKKQANESNLSFRVFYPGRGKDKPVILLSKRGENPELPSLLLSSHFDVVPVESDKWIWDPFEGHVDAEGNIYGRGSQDMKSIGIQYLEAMRRVCKNGVTLKRSVHLIFTPDEEVGSEEGMKAFVKSGIDFESLNIGVALDEGMPSSDEKVIVYNAEKYNASVEFSIRGSAGHGSRLIQNTSTAKAAKVINAMMLIRESEEQKLKSNPNLTLADVIVVNWTMCDAGSQINVLPCSAQLGFDVRLPANTDVNEFKYKIDEIAQKSGEDIDWNFTYSIDSASVSDTSENSKWWNCIKDILQKFKLSYEIKTFLAATDSRFLRQLGIQAYGVSFINNTPNLLHDNNEFINQKVFLTGIDIYYELIQRICSS